MIKDSILGITLLKFSALNLYAYALKDSIYGIMPVLRVLTPSLLLNNLLYKKIKYYHVLMINILTKTFIV